MAAAIEPSSPTAIGRWETLRRQLGERLSKDLLQEVAREDLMATRRVRVRLSGRLMLAYLVALLVHGAGLGAGVAGVVLLTGAWSNLFIPLGGVVLVLIGILADGCESPADGDAGRSTAAASRKCADGDAAPCRGGGAGRRGQPPPADVADHAGRAKARSDLRMSARQRLAASALALFAMTSAHADKPDFQKPLSCDRLLQVHAPVDADGRRVAGEITVEARVVRGRVDSVDFLDGRADLLLAAQSRLRELRCEKLDEPRTLRMTLVFSGKELNALPGFGPGSESMAAHNAFLREHFPTRVDALCTRPAIDLGAYRNVAILDDVQVELELGALPAGPITAPRRLTSSDSSRKAAPRRAASRRCAPATSR